ncbi:DUF4345 domain-containing protein [Variovorax paradoxus]|nr:DUF4345 domain-containing protein [Variovorax paradoxus]
MRLGTRNPECSNIVPATGSFRNRQVVQDGIGAAPPPSYAASLRMHNRSVAVRSRYAHARNSAHRASQLFLVAAIALFGGTVQLVMGQPEATPRLDNLHRFMGGVYLSMGVISFWTALTIRQQGTLDYLIAFAVLMAAVGRLVSISKVGLPEPASLWLGYLIPELGFPIIIASAHWATHRCAGVQLRVSMSFLCASRLLMGTLPAHRYVTNPFTGGCP